MSDCINEYWLYNQNVEDTGGIEQSCTDFYSIRFVVDVSFSGPCRLYYTVFIYADSQRILMFKKKKKLCPLV